MEAYMSIVIFSVIIKVRTKGYVPTHRSLKQDDPLSHFFFIIFMEGLNNMIKIAKQNEWIKAFEVPLITHFQHADDTLIFCEVGVEQLIMLRIILIIHLWTSF